MCTSFNRLFSVVGLAGLSIGATACLGDPIVLTTTNPTGDRWFYPFNFGAGSEGTIPSFAALNQPGFDDRDSQMVVIIDTSAAVTSGLDLTRYAVDAVSLRVTLEIASTDPVTYDPTEDSYFTSLDPSNVNYEADADAGKPIELFAAGYRGNASLANVSESIAFASVPSFPPQEGIRGVYAANIDASGAVVADVSRNVRQGFDASSLAVGQTSEVSPGATMPAGTNLTFTLDVNDVAARRYVQQGLQAGKLVFVVSSLHPASGGPGGPSGARVYPVFFSKENAIASVLDVAPKLVFEGRVRGDLDYNNDGNIDPSDIDAYFSILGEGPCISSLGVDATSCDSLDFNSDGNIDPADVDEYFAVLGEEY